MTQESDGLGTTYTRTTYANGGSYISNVHPEEVSVTVPDGQKTSEARPTTAREEKVSTDRETPTTKPSRGRPVGNVYKSVQSLYSEPSSKPKPEVFLHDEDIKNMDIDPVCIRETKEEATLPQTIHVCDNDRQWNNYAPGVDCKHVVVFDSTQSSENPKTGAWMKGDFKNQVGMMSCLDIAQVLSMKGKYLCACQHGDEGEGKIPFEESFENAKQCYKRRRLGWKVDVDGRKGTAREARCSNIKEEDDLKITPMERHCMECRESRQWEHNLARNISPKHPDGLIKVDANAVSGEPAKATAIRLTEVDDAEVEKVPKWDFHGSDYVRVQAVVGVGKKRAKRDE